MFFRALAARRAIVRRAKRNVKLPNARTGTSKQSNNNTVRVNNRKALNQSVWMLTSVMPHLIHSYNPLTVTQKRYYSADEQIALKKQQTDFFEETTRNLANKLILGRKQGALNKLADIQKVYHELLERLSADKEFLRLMNSYNANIQLERNKIVFHEFALKAAFTFGRSSDDVIKILKTSSNQPHNTFRNVDVVYQNIKSAFPYSPNINVWQGLSRKYITSPLFVDTISLYMGTIEEFISQDMPAFKKRIKERVTKEYEAKIMAEWNQIKGISEDDFVNLKLNEFAKDIKKEVQKQMKSLIPAEVQAALSTPNKNRTPEQEEMIAKYMADPSVKANEEKIKVSVTEKYRLQIKADYQSQQSMLQSESGENEFVAKRLAELQGDIKSACNDAEGKIMSEYTTLTELTYYYAKYYAVNTLKNDNEDIAKALMLFIENSSAHFFNNFMEVPVQIANEKIPDVRIEGAAGYVIEKLQLDKLESKAEAYFLGKLTGNCQSFGEAGEPAMLYGITSQNAGFYVIRDKNKNIVAQCLAWHSAEGNMVFDSIEPASNYREAPKVNMVLSMYRALAKELVDKHGIGCVKTGENGSIDVVHHNPIETSSIDTPVGLTTAGALYDSITKQYAFYGNVELENEIKNSYPNIKQPL